MDLDIQINNCRNELEDQDCAVCLQKYHYPTKLPCGHIFCFLCVKGIAIQSKKCAMCRKQIPTDYLDHPVLLENLPPDEINSECNNEEYQWYYEGRNGWWKYDDRSNTELESAFNNQETECTLLLAGTLYCVDFQNMLQLRRSDPTRRRRVRRDTPSLPSKGIAGIKKIEHVQDPQTNEQSLNITTSVQESELVVQDQETVDADNEEVQTISEEILDVENVIQSLSDMAIVNDVEQSSSPGVEDAIVQHE